MNTSVYIIYLIPGGKEIFQNRSSKCPFIYIKPVLREDPTWETIVKLQDKNLRLKNKESLSI